MSRRALLVGIDRYDHITPELSWCVGDALAMRQVLAFHANHDANYACRTLLGTQPPHGEPSERVTFNGLRASLGELFAYDGTVAFYFSGHGITTPTGTYLATQDGTQTLPGVLINDVLAMANRSPAREVLLLIDCCYAGALGEPMRAGEVANLYLREGVTLLAAAGARQPALEHGGRGVFTDLLLGALQGGAADVRGAVTTSGIYAYAEQALGPWDQRPVYKSSASHLSPIRFCAPDVTDGELRRLPQLFPRPDHQFRLSPSYEVTHTEALPEHVAIFAQFKRYQVARLLRPSVDRDLYFAALRSHPVELTPLGRFYWQLARAGLLGDAPRSAAERRPTMPDAESVAQLFHEAYERLAPAFGYETRSETRVPWQDVPERNKRLMIAVTAEVLAVLFPQGTSQHSSPSSMSAEASQTHADQAP